MPKRVFTGVVTSDKMQKTRRVEIQRSVKHPKYKKTVRRRTVCHVHDENEESHIGDTVEICECRPRSKNKTWELIKVVEKSRLVDVVAIRAQQRAEARAEALAKQKAAQEAKAAKKEGRQSTEASPSENPDKQSPESGDE